jgi:hypothetical protein
MYMSVRCSESQYSPWDGPLPVRSSSAMGGQTACCWRLTPNCNALSALHASDHYCSVRTQDEILLLRTRMGDAESDCRQRECSIRELEAKCAAMDAKSKTELAEAQVRTGVIGSFKWLDASPVACSIGGVL